MLLLVLSRASSAQVAAFDLDGPWQYVGSTEDEHPRGVRLAKSLGDVGAAWIETPVSVPDGGGLRADFTLELQPGWYGGGGLVFAVQGAGPYALGSGDYGLGYEGITPSVAIEFDLFQSAYTGDPDDNHVGVDLDGSIESVQTGSPWFDLDGVWEVHVWVDAVGGELAVYVSEDWTKPYDPVLVGAFDPLTLPDPLWVGFTAAAGDQDAARSVVDLWFVADGNADGDDLLDFEDPDVEQPPGSEPTDPTWTDPTGTVPGDDDDDPGEPSEDGDDDTAVDLPPVFFCGCGSGGPGGTVAGVLVVALVAARRRRPGNGPPE